MTTGRRGRNAMSETNGIVWKLDPPPCDTWVWARYFDLGDWRLVKTCKRGCCVYCYGETMVLPDFWKPATKEEAEAEAAKCKAIRPINMTKLYTPATGGRDG